MNERQKVITLTATRRWHSIVCRLFPRPQRVDALNLTDLSRQSRHWPGSAAIIELTTSNLTAISTAVAAEIGGANQLAVFAVGEPWLAQRRATMAFCGFAATFVTATDASRLGTAVARHWESIALPELDVETRWALRLPWNTIPKRADTTYIRTRFSNVKNLAN